MELALILDVSVHPNMKALIVKAERSISLMENQTLDLLIRTTGTTSPTDPILLRTFKLMSLKLEMEIVMSMPDTTQDRQD